MSNLNIQKALANIPSFRGFQKDEELVDVTLVCEKRRLQAHKVVLSAYSEFFREIFKVRNIFVRKYNKAKVTALSILYLA